MLVSKTWVCALFKHKLERFKKITNHVDEYKCTRCGQEFTINREGSIVKITTNLRERNNILYRMYLNREARNKN